MWMTVVTVWGAVLAGFVMGAWWAGSRRSREAVQRSDPVGLLAHPGSGVNGGR